MMPAEVAKAAGTAVVPMVVTGVPPVNAVSTETETVSTCEPAGMTPISTPAVALSLKATRRRMTVNDLAFEFAREGWPWASYVSR
jgi:hypothetical protein